MIADFIRKVVGKLFPKQNLEKKLGIQIATSGVMDNAITIWLEMYKNQAPWIGGKEDTKSMNLPSSISEEFARLTLTEFKLSLEGSQRADFLNKQLQIFLKHLTPIMEMWCALGGVAIKPYVSGSDPVTGKPDKIILDVVDANRFYPTAFRDKDITGAVFIETKRVGDYMYTRLEHHNLEDGGYRVINKAYRSERLNTMTTEDDEISAEHPFMQEISLDTVEEWAGLEPETFIEGIDKPLFVYIKMPKGNNIDPHSPLGASVYSRAVEAIQGADEQYTRIKWEYASKETAIDAADDLFDIDRDGKPKLPSGRERLYRTYDFEGKSTDGFFNVFSPEIRDTALYHGLQEQLRLVEFLVGLAYGTISNPESVEKTATEIKTSKQRSYNTVSRMQEAWDDGLGTLIEIMGTLCDLYQIVPPGDIEKTCYWGDAILEDTDVEYQRRWSMVLAGKMKIEMFYAWYFGCTEEEAKKYLPEAEPQNYPPEE